MSRVLKKCIYYDWDYENTGLLLIFQNFSIYDVLSLKMQWKSTNCIIASVVLKITIRVHFKSRKKSANSCPTIVNFGYLWICCHFLKVFVTEWIWSTVYYVIGSILLKICSMFPKTIWYALHSAMTALKCTKRTPNTDTVIGVTAPPPNAGCSVNLEPPWMINVP